MRSLSGAVAGVVLVAAACSGPAPATVERVAAPIIGGTATTVTDYPAVAAIVVGGSGLCSGVLVTPKLVLTSAGCLDPTTNGLPSQAAVTAATVVFFGTVDINASQGTMVSAADTIVHPSYSTTGTPTHNLGLVVLASAVTGRTPLLVDTSSTSGANGSSVTQVGFGISQLSGGNPNASSAGKEYVATKTIGDCSALGLTNAALICFDLTNGTGTCSGDSGGPSLVTGTGGATVIGVHSFGDSLCKQYAVDTRVAPELAFIGTKLCVADDYCAPGCGTAGLPADPDCASDGGAGAGGASGAGGAGGNDGGVGGAAGATDGGIGGAAGAGGAATDGGVDGAAGATDGGTRDATAAGDAGGSGGTSGTGGATGAAGSSGGATGAAGSSGGGGTAGAAAGTERGPCYGNGTCNAGLVCLSSLCVAPSDAGADGGTKSSSGGCGCAASPAPSPAPAPSALALGAMIVSLARARRRSRTRRRTT